ncbi:hypothetical protein GY45DRAFT_1261077 [Cubamyces sp. BRFM 1775]|nr:hypothetical protein GY45DRAFT_1261077 [Cubamyces sp. BRFM 1775]
MRDHKAGPSCLYPNHYLFGEPEVALRSNFIRFERKFEVQQMILLSSGRDTAPLPLEADRYPQPTQSEKSYGLIVDPILSELWRKMQWRDHVETRRFVLALHWYYARQYVDQQHAALKTNPLDYHTQNDDAWMSRYLNHCRLQGIMDALDYQATGVVTPDDLNHFAAARPKDWSLLRWLVYWAIGWQVAMAEYKRRIYALLTRMYRLCTVTDVPPAGVPQYLAAVEPLITSMTCTFDTFHRSGEYEALSGIHFRRYTKEVEGTIWFYLETLQYDLDGADAIELLNGPIGGVETNALIILYILLRQHYNIMKLAQKVVISSEELASAPMAIMVVRDAMERRAREVASIFSARQLDIDSEMSLFAYGLLAGSYGPSFLPPSDFSILVGVGPDNDDPEAKEPDVMESEIILKYPCFKNEFYSIDWGSYANNNTICLGKDPLRPLLGYWAGRQSYNDNGRIRASTFACNFQVFKHGEPGKAIASPAVSSASWFSHPSVSGEFAGTTSDGQLQYVITIACDSVQAAMFSLRVTLSEDGMTLYGEQDDLGSFRQPSQKPQVVMKRGVAPEVMIFYPSPTALQFTKVKSLWTFAISAILYDIRRRRFSWDFVRERRDRKRLLSSLLYAEASNGYLHTEDDWERVRLLNITLPEDVQFFAYAALEPTKFPWLLPWCDGCHRVLRTVEPCLRCCSFSSATMRASSVALCDREECLDEYSRYPSNRILKTRTTEWTMDTFTAETGVTVAKLDELFERAVRAIHRAPSSIWEDECDFDDEADDAFLSGVDKELDVYGRFFSLACSNSASSLPRRTSSQWSLSLETDASLRSSSLRAPYYSRPRCIGCRTTVAFPCWVCTQCPGTSPKWLTV